MGFGRHFEKPPGGTFDDASTHISWEICHADAWPACQASRASPRASDGVQL